MGDLPSGVTLTCWSLLKLSRPYHPRMFPKAAGSLLAAEGHAPKKKTSSQDQTIYGLTQHPSLS